MWSKASATEKENIIQYYKDQKRGRYAYLVHAPASADERGRIAEVLDEADRLAEEHKTQIEKLRTEKSALMQQLLTGKRRVRV